MGPIGAPALPGAQQQHAQQGSCYSRSRMGMRQGEALGPDETGFSVQVCGEVGIAAGPTDTASCQRGGLAQQKDEDVLLLFHDTSLS